MNRVSRKAGQPDSPSAVRPEGLVGPDVTSVDAVSTAASERSSRYIQVADALRETVLASTPNTLLPTEERLAIQFDVSRVTIRRALAVLQRSGLITRQRGRGSIVSAPKLTRTLFPACTIEQDFGRQGFSVGTAIVGMSEAAGDEDIRLALEIPDRELVATLEMTRSVNLEVICHEKRCIRASLARKIDVSLLGKISLSELLEDAAGEAISNSDIETEILPAPSDVAEQLRITPGSLVLVQHFREFLESGSILQAGTMFYRVDRVRFKMYQGGAPFHRSGAK